MRGAGRGVDGGDLKADRRGGTGSNSDSGVLLQGRETCSFPDEFTVGKGTTDRVQVDKRASNDLSRDESTY